LKWPLQKHKKTKSRLRTAQYAAALQAHTGKKNPQASLPADE
jgi:hypothetical protein